MALTLEQIEDLFRERMAELEQCKLGVGMRGDMHLQGLQEELEQMLSRIRIRALASTP